MDFPVRSVGQLDADLIALAFETSRDCIKMLSTDGTLLLLNAGGAAVMGFESPTAVIGANWLDFWQGDERETARAALEAASAGRRASFSGCLATSRGDPRWWESTLTPLGGAAGEPERLLVVSRDVTAERRAERARRWSESVYRTLVEATAQVVWSRDLASGSCDRRGWAEFTGHADDASGARGWLEAVHPDDRGLLHDAGALDPREAAPVTRCYRLRSRTGEWRWVQELAVPVRDEAREIVGHVGVITDIHERRTAEDKLRDESLKLRLALDSVALGLWEIDLRTGACRMPPDTRRMLGLADDPARGLIDVLHPEDREAVVLQYRANLARATGMSVTSFRIVRPDTGETRFITSRGRAVLDDAGRVVGRIGTFEDGSERRRTRDALRATLRRYQALLQATSVIVWHADADQNLCERQGWAEFTGQSALASRDAWLDAIHPADRAAVAAHRDRSQRAGRPYLNEYRLSHVEGGHRWVKDDVVPLRAEDGTVEGWVGIISDIHERRIAEQALRASEERLRLASEVAGLGTYDVDLLNGTREWSPEFYDLLRLPRTVTPDRGLFLAAVHADDRARLLDDRRVSSETHGTLCVTNYRLRFASGEERWMEERERLFLDAEGRATRRVGTMQDVTDRKRAEHELWLAAHADALTGLANRTLFQARLEEAIARADAHGTEACILVVDVDRFKDINDTLGHDAGDAVLRAMAERLVGCCPKDATVARLGGDEFGVILSGERRGAAPDAVGRHVLEALRQPVIHEGREIECAGSVGWSAYPGHDDDAGTLLKNADMALYAAKKAGRNRVMAFDVAMRNDLKRRVAVLRSAKQALNADAVIPFYQPKISLRTGAVTGFEALLRWRDASGLRSPAELQEAFANPDLACRLGARMLDRVVADMCAWRDRSVPFGHVALNVSAPELHRPDFADRVLQALASGRLRPDQLEIEVTEGVLLDDATLAITRALRTLDEAGVAVSLDDFGTGYASLSHLRRFPVSWLKVDRSFIGTMATDQDAEVIVRAVVGLAHSLGLKAVAEGVEEPSQVDFLTDIGCDLAQGYLVARPMAAADLPAFMARWTGSLRGC